MPPLNLFGRDWHISSDDLLLPAVTGVLFHGIWSIILLRQYAVAGLPDDCYGFGALTRAAAAMLLASFMLTTLLQLWLMVETLQGAVLEEHKRRRVPLACYCLCVGYGCEMVALILGTVTYYEVHNSNYKECYSSSELDRLQRLSANPATFSAVLLVTTWVTLGVVMLLVVLLYNLYPNQDLEGWVDRVTCLSRAFCCTGAMQSGHGESRFERLARVLSNQFAPLGFTFTDMAAALVLVGTTHRSRESGAGSTAHLHAILSVLGHGMAEDLDQALNRRATEQTEACGMGVVPELVGLSSLGVSDLVTAHQQLLAQQASLGLPFSGAVGKVLLQAQHSDQPHTSHGEGAEVRSAGMLRSVSAPPDKLAAAAAATQGALSDSSPTYGGAASGNRGGLQPDDRASSTYSDAWLHAVKHSGVAGVGRPSTLRTASGNLSRADRTGGTTSSDLERPSPTTNSTSVPINEVPLGVLQDALHWHKYALAIYGTVMYVWSRRHSLNSCMNRCCCPADEEDEWSMSLHMGRSNVSSPASSQPNTPLSVAASSPAAGDIEQGGVAPAAGAAAAASTGRGAGSQGPAQGVPGGGKGLGEDRCTSRLKEGAATVSSELNPANDRRVKHPGHSAGTKMNHGTLPKMEPLRLQEQLARLAITQMANITASSVVYTNFNNVIEGLLPHMICVDHQKRCVVLAIRGSLSLEDCVTDILYDPVPLDDDWLLQPVAQPPQQQQNDNQHMHQQEPHPETRNAASNLIYSTSTGGQLQQPDVSEVASAFQQQHWQGSPGVGPSSHPQLQQDQQGQQQQQQQQEQLQRLPSTSSLKASPFTTAIDAAVAAAAVSGEPPTSSSSSRPAAPSRLQQSSLPSNAVGSLRATQSGLPPLPAVATEPPVQQAVSRTGTGTSMSGMLPRLLSEPGAISSRTTSWRTQAASDAAAAAAAEAAVAALSQQKSMQLASSLQRQPSNTIDRQNSTTASRLSSATGSRVGSRIGSRIGSSHPQHLDRVGSEAEADEAEAADVAAAGGDPDVLAALTSDRRAAQQEAEKSEYRPDVGSAGGAWYVHEGMFRCAKAIRSDLLSHQLLDKLLLGTGVADSSLPDCSDYSLMITGHSLGAGVAGLLALHYRHVYPGRVRAWCFAPPGGLMSPEASVSLADICCSLVTFKDMVPRMSLWTTERLRDEMMLCALRCKVSKARLLGRAVGVVFGARPWDEQEVLRPLAEMRPQQVAQYRDYRRKVQQQRARDPPKVRIAREFVPPGRVIWVEKLKVSSQGPLASTSSMPHNSSSSSLVRALYLNPGGGTSARRSAYNPPADTAAADAERIAQEASMVNMLGGGAVALEAVAHEAAGVGPSAGGGGAGKNPDNAGAGTTPGSTGGISSSRSQLWRWRSNRSRMRLLPQWSDAVAIIAGGMVVSRSMFSDHMPDTQYNWLKQVVRQMERGARSTAAAGSANNSDRGGV